MTSTNFTIENAKKAAVFFAKDSLLRGCLYADMPEHDEHNDNIGDAETLSTISALVVNEGVDGMNYIDAESIILAYLEEIFPDFA